MHWYFQLSSLVFIPSPVLPSSLFMPHNHFHGAAAQSQRSRSLSFLTQAGKTSPVCVFVVLGGCSLREIPALAVVENAWNVWGSSLWESCKSPVKVLWSFSSWTQWFWRSDSVVLEVFSSFSEAVIVFHDSKFHWRFYGAPTLFQADTPCCIHNFPQLSVTPELTLRNLGWSRLALAPHYQNLPKPTWSAAAFWESWGWSSTDWPRSLLRPSPQHFLSFVLIPT